LYALLLLSQGVHPELVQELLGYADIMTLNTYSHVIPSLLQDKTAWAMEDVLAEDSSAGEDIYLVALLNRRDNRPSSGLR